MEIPPRHRVRLVLERTDPNREANIWHEIAASQEFELHAPPMNTTQVFSILAADLTSQMSLIYLLTEARKS